MGGELERLGGRRYDGRGPRGLLRGEIFAAARSRFSFVVANPASPYPLSYLDDDDAPDVVVLSEAAYAKWAPSAVGATCADQLWTDAQGSFDEGPFCAYVPNWDGVDGLKDVVDARSSSTAQAALLYGADPALDAAAFVAAAYDAGVDYVYVTDRPVATPWDELPTFWDALVAAVASGDDGDDDACGDSSSWSYGASGKGCAKLLEDPSRCKKKSYDKVMGYEACPYACGLCDAASTATAGTPTASPRTPARGSPRAPTRAAARRTTRACELRMLVQRRAEAGSIRPTRVLRTFTTTSRHRSAAERGGLARKTLTLLFSRGPWHV